MDTDTTDNLFLNSYLAKYFQNCKHQTFWQINISKFNQLPRLQQMTMMILTITMIKITIAMADYCDVRDGHNCDVGDGHNCDVGDGPNCDVGDGHN